MPSTRLQAAPGSSPASHGPHTPPRLRADLHVHSYHSGYASHLRFLKTRDCYSDPEDVYRVAKARGMDLVCLTDHDSLDGCLEFLERHPDARDFIMGEEVECTLPARTRGERTRPAIRIHIGVLGMTERIHRDVQPLRGNVFELVEYLREQDVFFALNHLFFFFNGGMPALEYIDTLLPVFPALETRNGAMSRDHNALIEAIARHHAAGAPEAGLKPCATGAARAEAPMAQSFIPDMSSPLAQRFSPADLSSVAQGFSPATRHAVVGGSDAHTLAHVGHTWTEAPGATREEFLASLRAGRATVGGAHGGARRMAGEIYAVIGSYWAALLGLGRDDLARRDRLVGLSFSLASLPVQFIPAIVAAAHKAKERLTIRRVRREWQSAYAGAGLQAGPHRQPDPGDRSVESDAGRAEAPPLRTRNQVEGIL